MKTRRRSVALLILLVLAACRPGAAEYSESEAPKGLSLDRVTARVDLRFAPRSARLAAADAARLYRLVTAGAIGPADRVTVAAAGRPGLAAARTAAIAAELLRYGIVAGALPAAGLPPGRAVVAIDRALVTLPPCPNWSKPAAADFTNARSSNFGGATLGNLGRMVASPTDLAGGNPLGPALGPPAVSAVQRYLADRVQPPNPSRAGPILVPSTPLPPAAPADANR